MTSKEDADRRQAAKVLYDLQMGLLWEANMSELNNYDEEQDCFRIRDGRGSPSPGEKQTGSSLKSWATLLSNSYSSTT
jgi:hypothetical protein